MPARKNSSQLLMTKPLPRQRGHKMYLLLLTKHGLTKSFSTLVAQSHIIPPRKKCTSTSSDQTHPMPACSQNTSQHMLTKPNPCQRGQKMTIPYKRGQKYIYTCADDTHPIGENTENASKHMMTKPLPFQRGHKLTEYQRVNNHASEGKNASQHWPN